MSGSRQSGFGPGPISFCEIDAWSRLTATPVTPFDVEVLKRIDAAFLTAQAKSMKTNKDRKPPPKKR